MYYKISYWLQNNKGIIFTICILFLTINFSRCYKKSSNSDGTNTECDIENVTIKISRDPLPYIEEWVGCQYPVFMQMSYTVTNSTEHTIFLDRLKLEAYTIQGGEKFFDWYYIDQNRRTLGSGQQYFGRFDGILVEATIQHTPSLELTNGKNEIVATIIYNAGEDASCGSFSAQDTSPLNAGSKQNACP